MEDCIHDHQNMIKELKIKIIGIDNDGINVTEALAAGTTKTMRDHGTK